jgi:arsenate reductase-like glutaredoxin family protein
MAGKKSGSDNPWAEMNRLKLDDKEAKAPSPDSPRAATLKSQVVNSDEKLELPKEDSLEKTTVLNVVAASKIEEELNKTNEEGKEVAENEEVVEYSEDELQGMSLKELQALAKDSDLDFKGLSKEELIEMILEETGATESDEEILLSEDEETDEESLEAEEIDGEMSLEEALAILGEDSETEEDFSETEFEEVEVEVQEGDVSFELDDNNAGSN